MNRILSIDRQPMHEAGKPEVLWFGRDDASCFGMLHRPEGTSNRGVIFCSAIGMEALLAHRAWRHMADELAARGFWVLRLDYDGEGDSAGGPWEPHVVDAWNASIDAAVDVLHARGVTDVQLVGFRIGGALACSYTTTHPGISGLVLWWPCVRGAAYVREVRALSRFSGSARPAQRLRPDWFPDDSLEVVGFELAGETMRDLAEIDLVAAPWPVRPPAVLVLDRDDAPANDDLVAKLSDAGVDVDHDRIPGYEDMVTEGEHNSVIPWAILERIANWLDIAKPAVTPRAAPSLGAAGVNAPVAVESTTLSIDDANAGRFVAPGTAGERVVEEAHWIDGRFFAISTRPACGSPIRRASIVLCNAGMVNRVGPGRLHVTLARYWASLGFTVVRIDLGGAGDSLDFDPLTENQPLAPIRAAELRDVLTWVRGWTGFEDIVAYGLCSGAFNAFHAVTDGLDIDHLMLVNPGMFYLGASQRSVSTPEHALHSAHLLTRGFFDTRRWKTALRDRDTLRHDLRRVRELFGKSALSGYRVFVGAAVRNAARRAGLPVKASSPLPRDLNEMVARGVKVLIVFSTGESTASHLRTLGGPEYAALLDGDDFKIVNIDGGDHIFSPPGARQALIEMTTGYLENAYPVLIPSPANGADRQPSDVQG